MVEGTGLLIPFGIFASLRERTVCVRKHCRFCVRRVIKCFSESRTQTHFCCCTVLHSRGVDELYDHTTDSYEWTNLAAKPEHAALKVELAKHFPATNVETALSARGENNAERKAKRQAK